MPTLESESTLALPLRGRRRSMSRKYTGNRLRLGTWCGCTTRLWVEEWQGNCTVRGVDRLKSSRSYHRWCTGYKTQEELGRIGKSFILTD